MRCGVSELPATEARNARSAGLDRLAVPELVELLVAEQRAAADAVLASTQALARAVEEIVARLAAGGILHYVGAGSSGRIGMLDAAEMPPTFGTPANMVCAHLAGGSAAMERSVEGAEDDDAAGDAVMRASVNARDAVIGISASGGAAFVVAAIERARQIGAHTIALTVVAGSPLALAANDTIVLDTGAEALAGSTRMKAATAQKIALNTISTSVMVRLGKVHGNLMVDVVASNAKLRRRALRLICEIAGVDEARARRLLDEADGRVKVAVVMQKRAVDAAQAQALLAANGGRLHSLL
jgi:N-acetylmuramic acid 6-phosphate etherase